MHTRRSFLSTTGAVVSTAVLSGSSVFAATLRELVPNVNAGSGVIRLDGALFFDREQLGGFRALYASAAYEPLRSRIESLDRTRERKFLKDEIRYNDQLYDIARISDRAIDMAFHYLMTGDKDAGELATEYMDALMRFGRWDYFLEGGDKVFGLQRAPGATIAASICWDWLDGYADKSTRDGWLKTMGERGCEPSWLALYGMRYPDRVIGWTMDESSTYFEHRPNDRIDLSNWPHILNRTNLKAVPASALAIGAVAYARAFGADDRVNKWIEQSTSSLRSFGELYAVDGSYDEGVSYANYTSASIAQATVALERYESDADAELSGGLQLYDEINWAGYVDYLIGMSMATAANPAQIVNFGDASGAATAAVPYWVASRVHDQRARWYGDVLSQERDLWSLLWHPKDVEPKAGRQGLSFWHSALDLIVARTGYRPEDLVVAMRSGGPSNHEHADRNSLVFKWGGEVLVVDPSRPPYSFADPSWMMRTTAGHSAVLIDGAGHQYHDGRQGTNPSDAVASIIRTGEREGYVYWTSDATPAYQLVDDDIASVTRTVYVFDGIEAALVLDAVRKKTTPSLIEARFFGDNRKAVAGQFSTTSGGEKPIVSPAGGCVITIGNDTAGAAVAGSGSVSRESGGAAPAQFVEFDMARPLATARITAASGSGLEASVGRLPIPEENAVLHPFVSVRTSTRSLSPSIASLIVPYTGDQFPSVQYVELDSGATEVTVSRGVNRLRCEIRFDGDVPEVQVLQVG